MDAGRPCRIVSCKNENSFEDSICAPRWTTLESSSLTSRMRKIEDALVEAEEDLANGAADEQLGDSRNRATRC